MTYWHCFAACVMAYFLGSIPSAIWYGEAYHGIDVRKHGSGNAGATNTFRVLGKTAGSIVLFIDVLKGWTATMLAHILFFMNLLEIQNVLAVQLMLGFIAVLGHLFSIFTKFKGGKGVATALGMIIAVQPNVAAACVGVFLLCLVAFHYVSLSSIVASFMFPTLLAAGVFGKSSPLLIGFGFMLFAIVFIKHYPNIIRIMNGSENRIYLFKKQNK